MLKIKKAYYLNKKSAINITKTFIIPIMDNSDCDSVQCIYIIHCKLCNQFYVGQTGRSCHERIREHIYCIKNNKIYSEVATHFNSQSHFYKKHLEYFIFKTEVTSSKDRHYIENDLINIILHLTGKIINSFIPRLYLMRKTITFALLIFICSQ